MKKILFLILLSFIILVGCSGSEDINNPPNPNPDPIGSIDRQDVVKQKFKIVRIGASDPEDVVASTNGITMPASSSNFYRNQTGLEKTALGFFGTVLGGDNGDDIPGYLSKTDKSYKSVCFFLLSQQDIDNGVIPNGKLITNTPINIESNGIGGDKWGGSMNFLNGGSYTIKKIDDSNILGETTDKKIIEEVRYDDNSDGTISFPIEMDKLVTRLIGNDMTLESIVTELEKNECDILILETVQNIDKNVVQYKLQ